MNATELGEILGIEDRQVQNLARKGIFHRAGKGKYKIKDCVQAYIQHKIKRIKGDSVSLTDQRTRNEKLKADISTLKLQEIEGRLVDKQQVEKESFEIGRRVRDAMLAIPPRITDVLFDEEDRNKFQEILLKEIYGALENLCRQ